jgi:hypothetical protein
MSVDASVVVQRFGKPLNEDFTELAHQVLGPGRSYVILATGECLGESAIIDVRLTAFEDSELVHFTMGSFPPPPHPPPIPGGGFGTFALTVAFTALDDEEFATTAIVEARKMGGPCAARARLLVLTVDSLSFLPTV